MNWQELSCRTSQTETDRSSGAAISSWHACRVAYLHTYTVNPTSKVQRGLNARIEGRHRKKIEPAETEETDASARRSRSRSTCGKTVHVQREAYESPGMTLQDDGREVRSGEESRGDAQMPFDDVGFLANQSPAFGATALVVGRRPSTYTTQQTYVHNTVLCRVPGLYAVRLGRWQWILCPTS
jgi:hypothetical protein